MRLLFFLALLLAACGQAPSPPAAPETLPAASAPTIPTPTATTPAAPTNTPPPAPTAFDRLLLDADYAAHAVAPYAGTKQYPDFDGAQRPFRNYRTALREGVDEGPNFAGRFALVEIGCGTNCRKAYLVDVATGETVQLSFAGNQTPFNLDLFFRADSALLNARWRNEPSRLNPPARCIHETYVLREQGLVTLAHVEAEGECAYIDYDDPVRTGVSGDPAAP